MIKKKLKNIRKKLDILDNKLLLLFKKRTLLVNEVLKTKTYKNQIVDKKRIKLILKNIKNKSKQKKIDPEITTNIWKTIIRSYIKYEFKNFRKK
ncbi:chorismate mutase [Pelagibacteraceae bacterium]|mgnify:FL=1|jgi:chorismate mutase|nr:chorismate mutase [Pelagibacteraceae bacterium]|tara:strand:+ start:2081 stop:2362 length:282 start_codon:yes stop_codon:yes gene_type:complete